MIATGTVTPADVDHVLAHLWRRGRDEAARFGLTDPAALRQAVEQFTRSRHAFAVRRDGRPVAVFGARESAPNEFATWFLATEDFGLAETKAVRRALHGGTQAIPGRVVVEAYSATEHPKAADWFRLLGFRLVDEVDGIRRYRYVKLEN